MKLNLTRSVNTVLRATRLTPTERLVLLAVVVKLAPKWEGPITIGEMMRSCALSERCVQTTLRSLELEGWLEAIPEPGAATCYRLSTSAFLWE
jgi:DNA-binding HxlR family transcriptional regulator